VQIIYQNVLNFVLYQAYRPTDLDAECSDRVLEVLIELSVTKNDSTSSLIIEQTY
jgi:hypothetical protein